jgi:methyl-accepting chemotaxis protein
MRDVENVTLWTRLGSAQLQAGVATVAVVGLQMAQGGPSWGVLGSLVVAGLWARAGGLLTPLQKWYPAALAGHGGAHFSNLATEGPMLVSDMPISVPEELDAEPQYRPEPPAEVVRACTASPEAGDTTEEMRGAAARGLTAADVMLDDVDMDLGRSQALLAESVGDLNDRFENLRDCSSKQLSLVEMLADQMSEPTNVNESTVTLGRYIAETDIALQEFVTHIVHVSKHSMSIAGRIEDITRQMDAIQKVTEQAQKLANQTSLLALNAKIEAARAGANARGFSVIADEVHGLAHESHEFNDQIGLLVGQARASVAATKVVISELASKDMTEAVAARARLDSMAGQVKELNRGIATRVTAVSGYASSVSEDVSTVVRILQFEDIITQIIGRSRSLLGGGQVYLKGVIPAMRAPVIDTNSRAMLAEELTSCALRLEAHLAETNEPAQQDSMGQGEIELF